LQSYDVIVLGLGGVGSATAAALAAGGYRVLGIDQYAPPHSRGSSHGETRVIRKAYFEHPDYVPMLSRAYELWTQLEQETGRQLYFPTGLLQIGPADGEVLAGVRRSADEHALAVEQMSMQQAQQTFPGVQGDPSWTAIVERNAGYLSVEQCVEAHLQIALRHHATLLTDQPVRSWQTSGTGVSVVTDQATFRAGSLVIAAGPWAASCLQEYRLPLNVIRKHVYWYRVQTGAYQSANFPCFFFDTPQGFFYGIPEIGSGGLKVGRHTGGEPVEQLQGDRHKMDKDDQQSVEEFLQLHLPLATREIARWSGCYYTMTSDQHFIVDRLPDCPQVSVVAGLSGHGFKFSSVLGQIAAHLATSRPSPLSIDFLRLSRFSTA
jgi:sarcosine oxidase